MSEYCIIFFMFICIFSYHVSILSAELYYQYVWCQHLVWSIAHLFPVIVIHAYFLTFFLGKHLKWMKKKVCCSAPNRPGLSNPEKNVNTAADNDALFCWSEITEELCLDMHKIIICATSKFYF